MGGKLPARASVIGTVLGENMKGRISNSDHEQQKYVRNAELSTSTSVANDDRAAQIRIGYNNFLASIFGTQTSENRGLGSILASAISQMGAPGISYVYLVE